MMLAPALASCLSLQGAVTPAGLKDAVNGAAFSPDGKRLAPP